jgi:hypothetical protein
VKRGRQSKNNGRLVARGERVLIRTNRRSEGDAVHADGARSHPCICRLPEGLNTSHQRIFRSALRGAEAVRMEVRAVPLSSTAVHVDSVSACAEWCKLLQPELSRSLTELR